MSDIQLASKSHMDEFLTEDPEISFFRPNYKRFSNFSIESVKQNIEGIKKFGHSNFFKLYRDYDMVNRITLEVDLPNINAKSSGSSVWVNNVGWGLMKEVELIIGGKLVDKHNSNWLNIYNTLTIPSAKNDGLQSMISHNDTVTGTFLGTLTNVDTTKNIQTTNSSQIVHTITQSNLDIFKTGNSSVDNYNIIVTESNAKFVSVAFGSNLTFANATGTLTSSDTIASFELKIGSTTMTNYDTTNSTITLTIDGSKNILLTFTGGVKGNYIVSGKKLYIPLAFAFNKYINNSLPIISLQYHEIEIKYLLESLTNLVTTNAYYTTADQTADIDINIYVDYVILNEEERKKNYFNPHYINYEYIQHFGDLSITNLNNQFSIALHNCVKEVFIVAIKDGNSFGDYSLNNASPFEKIELLCNGISRVENTDPLYYDLVQKFQHHTNITANKYIYTYSFALYPEKESSTGTCNLTQIDNFKVFVRMKSSFGTGKLLVYATAFNRLLIQNGISEVKFIF
jgi:hypothetical protein